MINLRFLIKVSLRSYLKTLRLGSNVRYYVDLFKANAPWTYNILTPWIGFWLNNCYKIVRLGPLCTHLIEVIRQQRHLLKKLVKHFEYFILLQLVKGVSIDPVDFDWLFLFLTFRFNLCSILRWWRDGCAKAAKRNVEDITSRSVMADWLVFRVSVVLFIT